jgi:excinuclease ABC subunit C
VDSLRQEQRVVSVRDLDQDVLGIYREGSVVEIELVQVRRGRVNDTLSFSLRNVEIPDEEVLSGFLAQYYLDEQAPLVPNEILLPVLPEGASGVAEVLTDRAGRKVSILAPQRGSKVDLLQLARENAAHAFREKQRGSDDLEGRLEELRERLRLPSLPHRIECCDISHLGGGDTVGSIVSLLDGQPDKKNYRSFHVHSTQEGDDYSAMYEVLARRFRRGRIAAEKAAEDAAVNAHGPAPPPVEGSARDQETPIAEPGTAFGGPSGGDGAPAEPGETPPAPSVRPRTGAAWELPDLLVVDGGRGQLGVALSAARDLGLHDLCIVGLAKERETVAGDKMVDRVYLPGQKNGIPLRSGSSALFFLARARDEAHRFANFARKRLGKARRMRSDIEDVRGLGPAVKKALLREIGSLAALRAASDERILAVPGVTRRHLAALRAAFGPPPEDAAPPAGKLS